MEKVEDLRRADLVSLASNISLGICEESRQIFDLEHDFFKDF